jgi:hypothetical protein
MVDDRTMEKYKKEAKEAGRETWYLSWALDLTNEERAKGKTVCIWTRQSPEINTTVTNTIAGRSWESLFQSSGPPPRWPHRASILHSRCPWTQVLCSSHDWRCFSGRPWLPCHLCP